MERVTEDYDKISNFTDPLQLEGSMFNDTLPENLSLASLLSYCGKSSADLTVSLFMVTREMVESGMSVLPLASLEPYYCGELSHSGNTYIRLHCCHVATNSSQFCSCIYIFVYIYIYIYIFVYIYIYTYTNMYASMISQTFGPIRL